MAGLQGEQAVTSWLAGALGDEWTLLRGYHNRRGEIDHLLLGPSGLVAIEVKYRDAAMHVDGDKWQFEKYDRYGNRVEEGWVTDRRGRSPSEQLNEPAGQLEWNDLTVHITTNVGYVVELVNASDLALEPAHLAELERLIVRDHAFHEGRHRRS
jgi:hypothetical protein